MQQVRAMLAAGPKLGFEPDSRAAYDEIIARSPADETVSVEHDVLGGVPGWWCRPPNADNDSVTLYLHGGGYVIGSAKAYRNFVGQLANRAGVCVFIADYALAPERPFPAALNQVEALHAELLARGYSRISLCGDSAGGGLALSFLTGRKVTPTGIVAVAALSPWIDLSVASDSMISRAADDPILSRETLAKAATYYLADQTPTDPRLAPLDGNISTMPPLRIDVGSAEVLLDDSLRFEKKAREAGVMCDVHVWEGMIHVFPTNFALLQASAKALDDIGAFLALVLRGRMSIPAPQRS